jgi:hypothetical protein
MNAYEPPACTPRNTLTVGDYTITIRSALVYLRATVPGYDRALAAALDLDVEDVKVWIGGSARWSFGLTVTPGEGAAPVAMVAELRRGAFTVGPGTLPPGGNEALRAHVERGLLGMIGL